MKNSERSFGDRLTRAREMQSITEKFNPPFDPAVQALQPANFATFLDLVETRNTLVANAGPAATAAIALHASLMATIKARTLRVVDYVSSNEAWDQFLPGVKQAANKVRNYSPSANKKETPDKPGEPPAKPKTKTGQQSYGDIDHWFEKLIEAVKLVPNYKPSPGSNIELVQLTALLSDYRQANKDVATTGAALNSGQRSRKTSYDGPDSLITKMKATKKAVGAQYGRDSAEYAAVKGIKL
jgi:hypothetical protein